MAFCWRPVLADWGSGPSVPNKSNDYYNVNGDVSHEMPTPQEWLKVQTDDIGGEMGGLKTVNSFRMKSEKIEMVARDDKSDAKSERNDLSSDFEMSRCQDVSGVVQKKPTL